MPTIAAAGWHATILHWTRNDGPLRPGELIVIDAGAETETLYTADITRTLPVSGTFTAIQREVYEIVLAAQQAALAEIAPGKAYRDYYKAVAQVLADGLFVPGLAGAQQVQAHPGHDRGQPAAHVLHAVGARTAEPQPGLLHGVVRLGRRAEHPVGHRAQARPVRLEALGQPVALVHWSPLRQGPS